MKHLDMQVVEKPKNTRPDPLPPSSYKGAINSADKLMMLSAFFGISVAVGTIVYLIFSNGAAQ